MLTRLSLKLQDRVRPLQLQGSVVDQLAQLQDYINQSEKNKYDQSRAIQKFLDDLNEKGALTISANSLYSSLGLQFPTGQGALVSDPNTLDDYAEGTWTPADASGATLTLGVTFAKYTKWGRVVFLSADLNWPATANASAASIGGAPFAAANIYAGSVAGQTGSPTVCQISSSTVTFSTAAGSQVSNASFSGSVVRFGVVYHV